MALIGGLLIVGIGIFMLGLVGIPETHGVSSSQGALCSFLVVPLMQVFVVMFLAFFSAAPIWLLFYLLCHLLIPRNSVL